MEINDTMPKSDPNKTFAGYAALMLVAGIITVPQLGIAGLLGAGAAIYTGACFMRGFTAERRKR